MALVPLPRGVLVGLAPPNKSPSPLNWNLKHYKSVEFLSIFNVKPPCTNVKPPRTSAKSPCWRLSGDGSGWHPGQKASLAPLCSNMGSFGSKFPVLNKVIVTSLGRFGAPLVIRRPGNCVPLAPQTLKPGYGPSSVSVLKSITVLKFGVPFTFQLLLPARNLTPGCSWCRTKASSRGMHHSISTYIMIMPWMSQHCVFHYTYMQQTVWQTVFSQTL